jgi:hypothetical protein
VHASGVVVAEVVGTADAFVDPRHEVRVAEESREA